MTTDELVLEPVKTEKKAKKPVKDTKKPAKDEVTEKLVPDFDSDTYYETQYRNAAITGKVDTAGRELVGEEIKRVFRPNFGSNRIRCKIRTAQRYNVPVAHLESAAETLNNRLLDGILINDLIGRTGFYDTQLINRADLATKLKTTIRAIEIADEKLGKILKHEDVLGAYAKVTSLKLADMKQKVVEAIAFGGDN